MKPLHKFRIKANCHSLFVEVWIWNTKKDMLAYRKKLHYEGRCEAYCSGTQVWLYKNPKYLGRKKPIAAEVHFYKAAIGTTILTHELFHATMCIARRLNTNFTEIAKSVGPEEEVLAYIHSDLCRNFVNRVYALGLAKP